MKKNLTFQEYQELSETTAIYPKEKGLEYLTLGLVAEAGEVAGKYAKVIRDSNSQLSNEKRIELLKECGDCIWFLSQLLTEFDADFGEVAQANLDKLFSRKERGVLGGSGDNR